MVSIMNDYFPLSAIANARIWIVGFPTPNFGFIHLNPESFPLLRSREPLTYATVSLLLVDERIREKALPNITVVFAWQA